MMVLYRSCSIYGRPLPELKPDVISFVDVIDEGPGGILNGAIASGSGIGIVSVAESATDLFGTWSRLRHNIGQHALA